MFNGAMRKKRQSITNEAHELKANIKHVYVQTVDKPDNYFINFLKDQSSNTETVDYLQTFQKAK